MMKELEAEQVGHVWTAIVDRPIIPAHCKPTASGRSGAVAEFEGIVRETEGGRLIRGIEYEAFIPMAEKLLQEIGVSISKRHSIEELICLHRVGYVPVGEPSLYVYMSSEHRKPTFAAMTEFIDELKRIVPIWKRPIFE